MSHALSLAFLLCLSLFVIVACSHEEDQSSATARGIPGAMGTIEFKPDDWIQGKTTWWKDTDGVDPGTPGCHIGTDNQGNPNDRMFGEACLPDGLLVESNPGAGELHSHNNDTGHPDTFDCKVWCIGDERIGGTCVIAPAPPCKQSAACICK